MENGLDFRLRLGVAMGMYTGNLPVGLRGDIVTRHAYLVSIPQYLSQNS